MVKIVIEMTVHSAIYVDGWTIGDTRHGRESSTFDYSVTLREDKSYKPYVMIHKMKKITRKQNLLRIYWLPGV